MPNVLQDNAQLDSTSSYKTCRQSRSETGKKSWKSNNIQLARENARLKKQLKEYVSVLNETTLRYEHLELAYRRRGETLSRVDILSHLAGNQVMKLVDTLTELRSACRVELNAQIGGAIENSDRRSYLRHSMPGRGSKSEVGLNVRTQRVNHVNPMISGHPIIKPTITLQRINVGNIANSPERDLQHQNPQMIGDPIEVDLTTIVENSSDSSASEEEEVIEVPANTRRLTPPCRSPVFSMSMKLPVAEVPLERLPLSQISGKFGSPSNKSRSSGVVMQSERNKMVNSSFYGTSGQMSPRLSVLEENIENCRPRSSKLRRSSMTTPSSANRTAEQNIISLDNVASVSNQRSGSSSVKKYPPSNHAKSLVSEQRSGINGDIENCRLVVALKDVGSYLHNGTLANIEKLEEGKVKTGASAQPESNSENSNSVDLSIPAIPVEDQTELNFTMGIGTLDYSAVPSHIESLEESSFSAKQAFLERLRSEDPLEGTSSSYASMTPVVRKRRRPRSLPMEGSPKKGKNESSYDEFSSPCDASKDHNLEQSVINTKQLSECKASSGSFHDNTDTTEMELTVCETPLDTFNRSSQNIISTENDCSRFSPTSFSNEASGSEDAESGVSDRRNLRKRNCMKFPSDTDSDEEYEQKRKASGKRRAKKKSNVRARKEVNTKQRKERTSNKTAKKSVNRVTGLRKNSRVSLEKSRSELDSPSVSRNSKDLSTDTGSSRPKRLAAPRSLKERNLNQKLRRE